MRRYSIMATRGIHVQSLFWPFAAAFVMAALTAWAHWSPPAILLATLGALFTVHISETLEQIERHLAHLALSLRKHQ
jgi:urea transporter